MSWRSSISRTLISTARTPSFRSTTPLPRLRPPPLSTPRRLSNPRMLGELGCAHSLLTVVAGARMTSRLTVNVRAFCELSNGTFCRSCQDR